MIFHQRETAQFHKKVEELLAKTYHTPISLTHPRSMPSRPNIYRFVVQEGPIEIGHSLVVKRLPTVKMNIAQTTRYPSVHYRFFNDWAGLQFLTQEVPGTPISPRLYVADRATNTIVMEDLKPESDGGAFLKGKDPQKAEQMLLLWGSVLGTLHARTIGKEAIFQQIRDALAPRHPSWGWVPHWQRTPVTYEKLVQTLPADIKQTGFDSFQWMPFVLRQATDALSLTVSPQAATELEIVMQSLSSPGPFLAYTHGDPCPGGNCLFTGNVPRLIDFENGDYRHALFDAVYARICFPTCWDAQQLPYQVVLRIEQAYRTELVKGCPEASDDRRFTQELVHACAYWVLMLCQFNAIAQFPTGDRYWRPYRMRQRIITRFERFVQTTAECSYLEALGSLFHAMVSTLRKRWPRYTQQLPVYPVFKDVTQPLD
ncbi:MAG: hypothetical protein ABI456_07960 [Ktedonobacteraceae bacterium]|nr:phosphotransferase [Chloroflexota bacterium]